MTTVALIDTDCDPDPVDLPIPGNDDSIRSIELIVQQLADAVLEGKTEGATRGISTGEGESRQASAEAHRRDPITQGREAAGGQTAVQARARAGRRRPKGKARKPWRPRPNTRRQRMPADAAATVASRRVYPGGDEVPTRAAAPEPPGQARRLANRVAAPAFYRIIRRRISAPPADPRN